MSVLGINASFIQNDVVVVRCLGIIQITKRHTGENIATLVLNTLGSFDTSVEHIFAATTDNGSNMVRTTRIINEILENHAAANNDELEYDENQPNEQCNVIDIDEDSNDEFDSDDGEANDVTQRFSEIVRDMTNNVTIQNDYIATIPEVRCCAHTLQLAVHDALSTSNARRILSKVKDICKLLRNQVVNTEFRRLSPKSILPPMDNATRWCSEYIMVNMIKFVHIQSILIQIKL